MKLKKKSTVRLKENGSPAGFTLIEIIVVLIILGVLAAIALPNIFSWIQKSHAEEAFDTISSLKDQLVPCLRGHVGHESVCFAGYSGYHCGTLPGDPNAQSCFVNPLSEGSQNFVFSISNYSQNSDGSYDHTFNPQGWEVTAYDPSAATNYIEISGNANDTQTVCWGSGVYQGMC